MKLNFKTLSTLLLLVSVFGLIFMLQTVEGYFNSFGTGVKDSEKAVVEISDLLLQIDKITFETSILTSPYFQSLNAIPNFPLSTSSDSFGKVNPFSSAFFINSAKATSTSVGGIIPSNQRQEGQSSFTTVKVKATTTRRTTTQR